MTAQQGVTEEQPRDDLIKAAPTRHPGRWIASLILLYLAIAFLHWLWTNDYVQWDVFRHFLTVSSVLRGLGWTMVLTVVSMVVGVVLGIILAVMRLSKSPIVSGVAWFYAWFFRGTPVLVQIIVWYNIAALTGPKPAVGLPFTGIVFFHPDINSLITQFSAAILALGLNEAAYMSEIVRAGFLAVDEGQTEAAQSLGMSRLRTIWRIVLPQAMRVIVPPTGNETISMLKTTSLVSVIAFPELLYEAKNIYATNYRVIELLLVACVWYLVLTTLLSIGQFYIERYYGRGSSRVQANTPIQRLRRIWVDTVSPRRGQA